MLKRLWQKLFGYRKLPERVFLISPTRTESFRLNDFNKGTLWEANKLAQGWYKETWRYNPETGLYEKV